MEQDLEYYLKSAIAEDIGSGDFSSLACFPEDHKSTAKIIAKENGIIAGIEVAKSLFNIIDPQLDIQYLKDDGDIIYKGEKLLKLKGKTLSILKTERLLLNIMQRMSGIATTTQKYVSAIKDLPTRILDTRKTTPNFRVFEKMAVVIGGGLNHRFGLYDMIMIKDNHIDFCGGIDATLTKTSKYINENNLDLKVIIEVRNINDIEIVLKNGTANRILLDNFSPELLKEGIELINGQIETEASGNINIYNLRKYAETGVDYISTGAITYSAKILDLSLIAS